MRLHPRPTRPQTPASRGLLGSPRSLKHLAALGTLLTLSTVTHARADNAQAKDAPAARATAAAATAAATAPVPKPTAASAPPTAALPHSLALVAGKSHLLPLPQAVERVSVAHPGVVDVAVTGPREVYLLARGLGHTNVMVWFRQGPVAVVDVQVDMDVAPLRRQLAALLPQEHELQVQAAADSVLLSGQVSSVVRAEQAVALAQGHLRALARVATPALPLSATPGTSPAAPTTGGGATARGTAPAGTAGLAAAGLAGAQSLPPPQVINLLQIRQPQQVMLEVKVAEVSRSLLDQFGISLDLSRASGSMTYGLLTQALQDAFGRLVIKGRSGTLAVDAKAQDGLIKVLAEPTIVALSGHEGSFLAGGKVFIPVARDTQEGRSTLTLEEKEYGVGLKFTPQVLDGDVVQLRVAPEVSELSRAGSPFVAAGGATAVLPSFTTRRANTTVQLRDGQSLAIAGLIRSNGTETLSKFPFLADLPVLGALFRSTEFQSDRTELLFVITPRVVKALPAASPLPTDAHEPPTRVQGLLRGRLEAPSTANAPLSASGNGSFTTPDTPEELTP